MAVCVKDTLSGREKTVGFVRKSWLVGKSRTSIAAKKVIFGVTIIHTRSSRTGPPCAGDILVNGSFVITVDCSNLPPTVI